MPETENCGRIPRKIPKTWSVEVVVGEWIKSLAIHVQPPLVCTYCKRNSHLKEKCYKKLIDEYRMLNDIHKPSSTRAEVSTSSSVRDDEETDKSRFLEKEI